jgi:hypothetical protein
MDDRPLPIVSIRFQLRAKDPDADEFDPDELARRVGSSRPSPAGEAIGRTRGID